MSLSPIYWFVNLFSAKYSLVDRFAHRLALGSPKLARLLFDLEREFFLSVQKPTQSVYVTGLARAGTTTLLEGLHNTNVFASLTYRDMPFVMSPNLWERVARFSPKKAEGIERAHGDGIQVGFDSSEALEEVFWRVLSGGDYIRLDHLCPHDVSSKVVDDLLGYQSLVCLRYKKTRYLAKNNNLLLRLKSLATATPQTTYVILFRDPIAQAYSLLSQHLRFAASGGFTNQYMTWLVHHEFGSTHRPFRFNGSPLQGGLQGTPTEIDYWLDRWSDAYTHLLEALDSGLPNLLPVSFEQLCNEPAYWARLCKALDLPETQSPFKHTLPQIKVTADPQRERLATSIYERLEALAARALAA